MYVSHLAKECQLMGYSLEWRPPAVAGAAKGLADAMDMSLKFDNYTNLTLFRRVITDETLNTDFGKFMYLSVLYVLRGPSEALPEQRAPLAARLDTNAPNPRRSSLAFESLRMDLPD